MFGGKEAAINRFILSENAGEVEIALFLLYHEGFKGVLVYLDHESAGIELAHYDSIDKSKCSLILRIILIKLLFQHILFDIVEQSLHSLCKNQ